mgnify:CR=1 FL=1
MYCGPTWPVVGHVFPFRHLMNENWAGTLEEVVPGTVSAVSTSNGTA